MWQYDDLLKEILEDGEHKMDRTGVGCKSIFGPQLWFNLENGPFPAVWGKKLHWANVVRELLWMIRGSVNTNDLGAKFWDSWSGEDGELGPIYGKQFRSMKRPTIQKLVHRASNVKPGRVKRSEGGDELGLRRCWYSMMQRCYCKSNSSYKSYGGKGVFVDERWHRFETFQKDVQQLPGWWLRKHCPESYSLDKDFSGCNWYGPDTCRWASRAEQSANTGTNKPFVGVSPKGNEFLFSSVGEAHREHGLNLSAVHRCLTGKLKSHHGWRFRYVDIADGYAMRWRYYDPLLETVVGIKENPGSRRHVMTLWSHEDIEDSMLPPCHGTVIQFHVGFENDRPRWLDLKMYQRSCDAFIGLPWNIAEYSLLLLCVAQLVDLEPRMYFHSFGDVHIYDSHHEAVEKYFKQVQQYSLEQADSQPRVELPEFTTLEELEQCDHSDFKLLDYVCGPAIPAPVAV